MEFKVNCVDNYYYISDGKSHYLWKDGTINEATGKLVKGSNIKDFPGYWSTERYAQDFLKDWLPSKGWLTKEGIEWAAKYSDNMALLYSLEHWKQILLAGYDKFEKAYRESKVSVGDTYCALCLRHRKEGRECNDCPLNPGGNKCCDEWYKAAVYRQNDFEEVVIPMVNKLVKLYNLEEKKMGAKIDFGNGKVVELSKETEERIRKELLSDIPNRVAVGQIYNIENNTMMVASLGEDNKVGLTHVDCYAGCYNGSILNHSISKKELRNILIKLNAEYLGRFLSVFEKI